MSGENQVTRPALDSSVSAEVMRLGFEAARHTVIKRRPMLITADSASLTIRCISNAAAKPSRLDEGLKPPGNSHKALMRISLIALVRCLEIINNN